MDDRIILRLNYFTSTEEYEKMRDRHGKMTTFAAYKLAEGRNNERAN